MAARIGGRDERVADGRPGVQRVERRIFLTNDKPAEDRVAPTLLLFSHDDKDKLAAMKSAALLVLAIALPALAADGPALFKQTCAPCHANGEAGVEGEPDVVFEIDLVEIEVPGRPVHVAEEEVGASRSDVWIECAPCEVPLGHGRKRHHPQLAVVTAGDGDAGEIHL